MYENGINDVNKFENKILNGMVYAIIPARGGSKTIPKKNIKLLAGKPLIFYSIEHARQTQNVDKVFVSSDDDQILKIANQCGANTIKRPKSISSDNCSSESAWIHALEHINSLGIKPDLVVGIQCTSPIRESNDLDQAINYFLNNKYDSLLSAVEVEDYFAWELNKDSISLPLNHDVKKRKPRQKIKKTYLENGSFYIFKPDLIKKSGNRLIGKIGMYVMAKHKAFQIDNREDIKICSAIIKEYGISQ